MVSAAGASLPNADTVSFTEGVDVLRRDHQGEEDEDEEVEGEENGPSVKDIRSKLNREILNPI